VALRDLLAEQLERFLKNRTLKSQDSALNEDFWALKHMQTERHYGGRFLRASAALLRHVRAPSAEKALKGKFVG
jgi:hypothetical protein